MAALLTLHVLVIDDDADTRSNLCDILALDGYGVATAATAKEALSCTDWSRVGAILLDRKLPDGSAEELLPRLKQLAPNATILIVTGYADLQGAIAALRMGAADYILKPINPDALRASLARVAEQRQLMVAKERSEMAFRTLVEAAPCMIVIMRPDFGILYFSRYAEGLTGYTASEVIGKNYFSIFLSADYHQPVANDLKQVFAGIPTRGYENPIQCKNGSQRWMIWNVQRLSDYEGGPAALAVGQDITGLKHAQDQALRSERLAAIGEMMAGLAHESGNALARSQTCLEMLALEVQDKSEALELIASIQKAQEHLQQLYEEVRGYAAPVKLEREVWDVSTIWRQAWEHLALQRQGKQASVHERCGNVDLRCAVDPLRLGQVFRNILANSLDACSRSVRIEITCSDAVLGGHAALCIAIRDNGPGLSVEQSQRIFEPFFTTKTKGTGLGMAIAKRIVDAHGGQIAVGHGGQRGTEILITLPHA